MAGRAYLSESQDSSTDRWSKSLQVFYEIALLQGYFHKQNSGSE